jgi:RNA polymerase sigma-70 factor (ECF subfamily)
MDQRPVADSVEAVFREDRGRLLAMLVTRLGDLDLAEEVASEAMAVALVRWPEDGVPESPLAWLLTVARRKAIDRIRRDRTYAERLAVLQVEADRAGPGGAPDLGLDNQELLADLPDERLALFFTCCHPALPPEVHIPLVLRFLSGLTTPEVARAFLVPVPTMAQRIVRAKAKIRSARIPFRVPGPSELSDRLPSVLLAVYLIFTEGYHATSGTETTREALTEEAIRLGRILHRLLPADQEVSGLLALMLLIDARRPARTDPTGCPISLEDQDRSLWDPDAILEGQRLVLDALAGSAVGPYGVQAAIAALHDEAADVTSTDWPQIVSLYDVLLTLTTSPLVALNRAVAVAMRDGPAAGLDLINQIEAGDDLRDYHLLPAARADLLHRLGRHGEALAAYGEALSLAGSEPDRVYFARRMTEVAASAASGDSPSRSAP